MKDSSTLTQIRNVHSSKTTNDNARHSNMLRNAHHLILIVHKTNKKLWPNFQRKNKEKMKTYMYLNVWHSWCHVSIWWWKWHSGAPHYFTSMSHQAWSSSLLDSYSYSPLSSTHGDGCSIIVIRTGDRRQ